jgi:PAS domain-containing protein
MIREANLAAATLLETPRVGLVGRPLTRFILPEDQDILYRCGHRLRTTGEPQTCELRLRKGKAARAGSVSTAVSSLIGWAIQATGGPP